MFQQQGLYLLNYYVYFAQYAYIQYAYMTYCSIFTVYAVFMYQFTKNEKSITCSPKDPLQWMGAVRMRVQTDDHNNPQVIHTTPVHRVCKKQIHH